MPTIQMPPELELAAHYFCDLSGKDAKAFVNSKKKVQNWQAAAAFLRDQINAQRALFMASKQIAEEESSMASQNGHAVPDDIANIPDPLVILP